MERRYYIFMLNLLPQIDLLAWALCCQTSDHVMILLQIVAFKLLNSPTYERKILK